MSTLDDRDISWVDNQNVIPTEYPLETISIEVQSTALKTQNEKFKTEIQCGRNIISQSQGALRHDDEVMYINAKDEVHRSIQQSSYEIEFTAGRIKKTNVEFGPLEISIKQASKSKIYIGGGKSLC